MLDLKQQQGREALLKLVETADVLVYNLRPQVMERLRLGYADVAASNPKIIYAGLFGYGQDGPYAARPAYDDLMQGGTGIPSLVQRAGNPAPRYAPGSAIAIAWSASGRSAPSPPRCGIASAMAKAAHRYPDV